MKTRPGTPGIRPHLGRQDLLDPPPLPDNRRKNKERDLSEVRQSTSSKSCELLQKNLIPRKVVCVCVCMCVCVCV